MCVGEFKELSLGRLLGSRAKCVSCHRAASIVQTLVILDGDVSNLLDTFLHDVASCSASSFAESQSRASAE